MAAILNLDDRVCLSSCITLWDLHTFEITDGIVIASKYQTA